MLLHNLNQGWVLTLLSSVLCVLGCFIIFLDDVYYWILPHWFTSRHPFHIKENYGFMNGSLAFSSGCLLFTALFRLLPEALSHLDLSNKLSNSMGALILAFIVGIVLCVVFNETLHHITAELVVHCSHDGDTKDLEEVMELPPQQPLKSFKKTETGPHGEVTLHAAHTHAVSAGVGAENPENSELPELFHGESHEHAPLLTRKNSARILHYFSHEEDLKILGECKGYSSAERCLHRPGELHFCEIPQLQESDASGETLSEHTHSHGHGHGHGHGSDEELGHVHEHHVTHDHMTEDHLGSEHLHHHHHVNLPLLRLMLIGVQTMLAITLHKFPEGFITYVTSQTNPELGVLIFLSLLIHNYTEGFSMCLPLYYLFGPSVHWRKLKAVSASALLGGLSQPLGALAGWAFMQRYPAGGSVDLGQLDKVYGITMSVTAGFLVVIALLMYGSAVSFCALPNFVMVWCLVGMSTIGVLAVWT